MIALEMHIIRSLSAYSNKRAISAVVKLFYAHQAARRKFLLDGKFDTVS